MTRDEARWPAFNAIRAQLEAAGVDYTHHQHIPVATIEQARAEVPHLTVNLLKTIVFRIDGTERVVLAAVRSTDGVDYKRLAGTLGCSRRKLRLLDGAGIEALGFEVGGVGPFAVAASITVIIDADVAPDETVCVGGGTRSDTYELGVADLLTVSGAMHVAIAKDLSHGT